MKDEGLVAQCADNSIDAALHTTSRSSPKRLLEPMPHHHKTLTHPCKRPLIVSHPQQPRRRLMHLASPALQRILSSQLRERCISKANSGQPRTLCPF